MVAARDKAQQTVRFTGTEPAEPGEGAAYDPNAAPARIEMPRPAALVEGGLADPKMIQQIFGEIALPPIKPPRERRRPRRTMTARLAAIVPFRAEALKGYEADYASFSDLLAKPKEYPLRVAVIHAVEALDKLARSGDGKLMDEFRGQTTDDVKKSITDNQKEGPARLESGIVDGAGRTGRRGRPAEEGKVQTVAGPLRLHARAGEGPHGLRHRVQPHARQGKAGRIAAAGPEAAQRLSAGVAGKAAKRQRDQGPGDGTRESCWPR